MVFELKRMIDEKKKEGNGTLFSQFSDRFGTKDDEKKIEKIPLNKLVPYLRHPFKSYSDERLKMLSEDIKVNGLIHPIIVRQYGLEDRCEILSGHSRAAAMKLTDFIDIDAIVVKVTDSQAVSIVIKSNILQREKILPSEKAKSYYLRNEVLKKQKVYSKKSVSNTDEQRICDVHSAGWNEEIYKQLEDEFGDKKTTIFLYMRLNSLTGELLELVDSNFLSVKLGAELSSCTNELQELIYDYFFVKKLDKLDMRLLKEIRMKISNDSITEDKLRNIIKFYRAKQKPKGGLSIKASKMKKYNGYFKDKDELEKVIFQFLDNYIKPK